MLRVVAAIERHPVQIEDSVQSGSGKVARSTVSLWKETGPDWR
jgi:hypothetical protein